MTRDWRFRAACREVDPELFFPPPAAGPSYDAQVAKAKAVCAGCPVRAECLDEALRRIPDGICGGLTPEERRAHRGPRVKPASAMVPATLADAEALGKGGRRKVGIYLLGVGRPVGYVRDKLGVEDRTVQRWAANLRAAENAANAAADAVEQLEPVAVG